MTRYSAVDLYFVVALAALPMYLISLRKGLSIMRSKFPDRFRSMGDPSYHSPSLHWFIVKGGYGALGDNDLTRAFAICRVILVASYLGFGILVAISI
jgi:hypothetical protein